MLRRPRNNGPICANGPFQVRCLTTASSEMAFWAAQDSMAIEWPMIPMKATGADAGDDDDDDDDSDDGDDGDDSDAAG